MLLRAADLQLKMGSATRNLSLALQQCDIKHNMDARSKLVSERLEAASCKVPWHPSTLQGCSYARRCATSTTH